MPLPRANRRASLCFLAGAFLNVALAQSLGWWLPAEQSTDRRHQFLWRNEYDTHAVEFSFLGGAGKEAMSWLAYAPGPQRGAWHYLHDLPTTLSSAQSGFQAPALDGHAAPESLPALPAFPDMVPSWSRASDFAHRVDEQAAQHGTTDVAIGWPALSFSTCIAKRIRGHPTRGTVVLMIEDGYSPFKRDPNLATQRLLAWRPIFPGLILSSLFWSSALWLLAALYSYSRATLRHRKHLCTLCSYDTRGFAFCPECATPRANAPSLLSHVLARDAIRLPSVNQKIHVRLTPS